MTLQSLRDLVKGDEVFTFAARVAVDPKSGTYYEINDEGYLIVSCVTLNGGHQVWANFSMDVSADGRGVWRLPGVGTEVLVASDHGEFEGELYVVGKHSRVRSLPPGVDPSTVVLQGAVVEARDVGGTAVPLTLKSDTTNDEGVYNGHGHGAGSLAIPTNATTTALGINGMAIVGSTAGPSAAMSAAQGTTILKGQ